MKVTLTWTPPGSALTTNFVVCDSPAVTTIQNFTILPEHEFQEAKFFRATTRQYYDRGNEASVISFLVSRGWPDIVTAQAYVASYNTKFPRQANITMLFSNGPKSSVMYLANAIIVPAKSYIDSRGACTTWHEHQFKGGIIQTAPPS